MKEKNLATSINPYEQALEVVSSDCPDFELGRLLLRSAHKDGDRRATYALATWFLFGYGGLELNLRKAIRLLKIAAKADISAAHFDLAISYEKGIGLKKNLKAAYRHYLAAALNGDNNSYGEIGRCLYYGIGIARDRKTAEIWFRRAEALGVKVR